MRMGKGLYAKHRGKLVSVKARMAFGGDNKSHIFFGYGGVAPKLPGEGGAPVGSFAA